MGNVYSTNKSNKEEDDDLSYINAGERTFVSSHRAARIFNRRYHLTPITGDYVEIGISVGADSYVELVLGNDTCIKELVLPIATWNLLMHKRADVERLARSAATPLLEPLIISDEVSFIDAEIERKKRHFVEPIKVQDLTIDVAILTTFKYVRLTTTDRYAMCIRPSDVIHLFDFDDCINNMYSRLSQKISLVNDKFKRFVSVLQRNNITNVSDAVKTIRESDAFYSESSLDCELLTCAIRDILYAACNE